MKINLHLVQLRLKEKFIISRDAYSQKKSIIIELSQNDYKGYGEACEHVYYQNTAEKMTEAIENIQPLIEKYNFTTPEKMWSDFSKHLSPIPFAQCALDQAAHDLFGKMLGKPSYQIWNLSLQKLPISNYTLGIGKIDDMVEKLKANPFPIYKIKLGTEHDIEIIEALRKHTDAIFRIDANCAWTAKQTISYSKILKKLGVELIEQPLPAHHLEEMEEVFQHSALPLFADESCQNLSSIEQCKGRFHGINIKLMKCGGITPAVEMIKSARQNGLKVMMGCMTEGSIGISAIAHLLPLLDYVDMDAALLLANDPAEGVDVNNDGTVTFPKRNGLGAILKK